MGEVRYTRNLFLRGICIIYLFSFLSFYLQIPGLYGDNGILPARTQIDLKSKFNLWNKLKQKPTFVWFAPYLGLNVDYMLDVVALIGTSVSFLGFVSQSFCIAPVFMLLWSLYYSLYQVGQVFVQYQWDNLLLETGFLCVLIAPFYIRTKKRVSTPSDAVTFWSIRWLLFRFMFTNVVTKLTSGCPIWWSLEGLSHHFETQCLPGSLAWFAHHLPSWYLRLNSVLAIVYELVIPFFFFFPIRKVRIAIFYIMLFMQVHIIATGNWNIRDFLVICLSISLLDDQFFYKRKSKNSSGFKNHLSTLISIAVYAAIVYGTVVFFKLRLLDNWTIQSEMGFTQQQFDDFLSRILPISVYIGIAYLAYLVADAVTQSIFSSKGTLNAITTTFTTLLYIAGIASLFAISVVPFSSLHPSYNSTIPTQLKHIYSKVDHLHIANGYSLFDRMTGVDGRPEIIIEGSDNIEGPWKEYEFLYKPGNINNSLPFVAPHSPRLDWQMWFAARGTYHQNPWIMSLTYRLLTGQKEVLNLINQVETPFSEPPKYIKASLYHYHFAPWGKTNDQRWWLRERIGEYFPIFSRDHPPLLDYLKKMRVLQDKPTVQVTNEPLKMIFDYIRMLVSKIESSLLLWSVFTAGCAIIMTSHSNPSPKKK